MNVSKRRILINSFFNSQLNYCPLVWMFHRSSINNNINRLHERVLRIVYNDFNSLFKNLLEKDRTVSINVKNLRKPATEMFKISKKFSVPVMSELFHQKVNQYDLRNPYEFSIPHVNSVFHIQVSITYLSPLIQQLVPSEFTGVNTVVFFLPGLLLEGFSVSGRLFFLKCFIFIFICLIFKFFYGVHFSPLLWLA